MSLQRRDFLKTLGLVGATLTVGSKSIASTTTQTGQNDFKAILIDTTRCLGCRACEWACSEQNGLPDPPDDYDVKIRKTSTEQFTVVNEYGDGDSPVYAKKQCMHCVQPACASACLTKAMYKTEDGPVIWRKNKCIGCRPCMLSCPFDVPKFEYDNPNPDIKKCQMCFSRLKDGEIPACVENCGGEALMFGTRQEMLEEARTRIYNNPDDYYHHIYGEHEVGGTGVLYLSAVPFEDLDFRNDLGEIPYPEYNKGFLYSVPFILTLWPAFLLGIHNAVKDNKKLKKETE